MKKILWRCFLGISLFSLLFVVYLAFHVRNSLTSTLPKSTERPRMPGLPAAASVSYDPYGVPTLVAPEMRDAVRLQGYVVARDRLFQMDLIRRKMQGRLSELLGKKVLPVDQESRLYGFTQVADGAVERMGDETRQLLEAYAEGVNAWASENPSFEMKVLRYSFEPWKPRDSVLVVLSMFQSLDNWENASELALNAITKKFPKEVADFLSLEYGFLDAPILKDPSFSFPPIPRPEIFDLRLSDSKKTGFFHSRHRDSVLGSNAFLIAGKKTQSGSPILGGDPHLKIGVPNIWYRVKMQFGKYALNGAALVGVPFIVIGTNGGIAWTFTDASSDTVDFVPLKESPDGKSFEMGDRKQNYRFRREVIRSRWGTETEYTVKETEWGPVIEVGKKKFAVQWNALDSAVLAKLDLRSLATAQTLAEALEALKHWGGPVQNCFIASSKGDIAWTVVGNPPNRVGFDGRTSVIRDENHAWKGYLPFSQLPKVVNPPEGFIANGNQRMVAVGKDLFRISSDYPSPARGYRIRELLAERNDWTVARAAEIQLDTLTHTHLWYRDRLLSALEKSDKPWTVEIKNLIRPWDGRVYVDAGAYAFLKEFRLQLFEAAFLPFLEKLSEREALSVFDYLDGKDAVLSRLLVERPVHLLHKEFTDYDHLLVTVATLTAQHMVKKPADLATLRWGNRNVARYEHVFAKFFPPLSRWLSMPHVELNGDSLIPRVEEPDRGASLRLIVDFGDLSQTRYSQPGGQSGHPFSPHYGDLFPLWARGEYVSF